MTKCRLVFQVIFRNTKIKANRQLHGRTNAYSDDNTHRQRCLPRVSYLDTTAWEISCHSFQVICQQIQCAETWKCGELTDRRTGRRTEGQTSGRRVFLCPPQLGTGQKCGQKWKFKMQKKTHYDLEHGPMTLKMVMSGHCHYQYVYAICK